MTASDRDRDERLTMALNLIMLGPPGAGKGTQAERFARSRAIPKISTGEMLREAVKAGTETGRRAKEIMDRGELVSDDVMIGIVKERLDREDARAGFILDGFPRTVAQAQALDQLMTGRAPLIVVDIVVPEEEIVRRLGTRMICSVCGANADEVVETVVRAVADQVVMGQIAAAAAGTSLPPDAAAGVRGPVDPLRCRHCGGKLEQRADDNVAVVIERLKVYHRNTEPLVDYYRARPTFRAVNGAQAPDGVAADLVAAIKSAGGMGDDGIGAGR
jgi:adenylate kinase